MKKNTLFIVTISLLLGILVGQNWPHTVVSGQAQGNVAGNVIWTQMPDEVTCYVPSRTGSGIVCLKF